MPPWPCQAYDAMMRMMEEWGIINGDEGDAKQAR